MKLWYTNEAGKVSASVPSDMDQQSWRKRYWDAFYQDIILKSKDWGYEQESRLILKGLLE